MLSCCLYCCGACIAGRVFAGGRDYKSPKPDTLMQVLPLRRIQGLYAAECQANPGWVGPEGLKVLDVGLRVPNVLMCHPRTTVGTWDFGDSSCKAGLG